MDKITSFRFVNLTQKYDVKLSTMWYNDNESILLLVFNKEYDVYIIKHFYNELHAINYLESLKDEKI